MSGQLLEIKKKINSVKNTRKITKAMQLVAASKMRQFQKRALSSRGYVWELLEILKNNLEEEMQSPFVTPREFGKTLFVLYTSDKGLCGPLNTKLMNALFRSEKWNSLPPEERLLIIIGKKALTFAKNNEIPVYRHFVGIPEKLSNIDAIKVVDVILDLWKNNEENVDIMEDNTTENDVEIDTEPHILKEVIFVTPHYKNSFTSYPILKTFLPFSIEAIESNINVDPDKVVTLAEPESDYMIFDPTKEDVLNRIYELMIQGSFIQSFMELKAAEYSSRMIAMQNATDAADKKTNQLNLDYNKARQQAITQQIAELIGASLALSDES